MTGIQPPNFKVRAVAIMSTTVHAHTWADTQKERITRTAEETGMECRRRGETWRERKRVE